MSVKSSNNNVAVDALVDEILRVCDGHSCVQVALALGSVARQVAVSRRPLLMRCSGRERRRGLRQIRDAAMTRAKVRRPTRNSPLRETYDLYDELQKMLRAQRNVQKTPESLYFVPELDMASTGPVNIGAASWRRWRRPRPS
jgi:hypothetical protein